MTTSTATKEGKVLMERESLPHKIEMIYWGPAQPCTIAVTHIDDGACFWVTPENQQDLLDCFNHPFSDYWRMRAEVPDNTLSYV